MNSSLTDSIRSLIELYLAENTASNATVSAPFITTLSEEKSMVFRVSAEINGVPHSWIAKQTTAAEAEALELLAGAGAVNVPELLAKLSTQEQSLVLTPSYSGSHRDFGDPVPDSILQSLAYIHSRFINISCSLPPTNRTFIETLVEHAFNDFNEYATTDLLEKVQVIRDSVVGFAAIASGLPQTLVHFDVHPKNILNDGDKSVLIDWELARIGPGMIDLANLVQWDSRELQVYARASDSVSGVPFNYEKKSVEYAWARAITQIKYLPFAVETGNLKAVQRMVNTVYDYARRFA